MDIIKEYVKKKFPHLNYISTLNEYTIDAVIVIMTDNYGNYGSELIYNINIERFTRKQKINRINERDK